MTDQELHSAYERQLRRSLHPPWEPGLDPGGTRAMLNASQVLGTADIGEADDGDPIWLWSDLHLGDHMALGSFGRPFDSVPEMDEGLLEAWHRTVGANDTIIVAGDVMLGSPRERPERTQRIIEAPGYKVLVYGNHDQNGQGGVRDRRLRRGLLRVETRGRARTRCHARAARGRAQRHRERPRPHPPAPSRRRAPAHQRLCRAA